MTKTYVLSMERLEDLPNLGTLKEKLREAKDLVENEGEEQVLILELKKIVRAKKPPEVEVVDP